MSPDAHDGGGAVRPRFGFALVVASAMLMSFREPNLLVHPRLWAEEGTVYLAAALRLPWWKALLSIHRGYFSLIPNVATVVGARLLPLAVAPWITTLASFGLQLLPSAIVAFVPSRFWRTKLQRVLIVLVLPMSWNSGEVWLNTINGQFWCVCISFLILLTDYTQISRRLHWCFCLLLILCGLNGVGAGMLMPLFLARAIAEREWRASSQALALGVASVVQLICVGLAMAGGATSDRLTGGQPQQFWDYIWVRGVLRGFVAPETAWEVVTHQYWLVAGLFLVATFLSSSGGWRGLIFFVGGFLLTAIVSLKFAVRQTPAPRYFFAPSAILLVMLIASLELRLRKHSYLQLLRCLIAAVAVTLFLFRSGPLYRSAMSDFWNPAWPRWPDEIARRTREPAYHPRLHPCDRGKCWELVVR